MLTCAWLWVYAGAALMLFELVAPGFVIFFFGLSATTVGALRFALGDAFSPTWQMAAFSVLSIVYIVLFRHLLKKVFMGNCAEAKTDFDHESVGRIGRVTVAIRPPLDGRVMIGDAEWTVSAGKTIDIGANVRVIAQENLTMTVEEV